LPGVFGPQPPRDRQRRQDRRAAHELTREDLVQRDGSEVILHGDVLNSVGELLLDKSLT
jgi:hypothetical protein